MQEHWMGTLGKLAIVLPAPFHSTRHCVALARRTDDEGANEAVLAPRATNRAEAERVFETLAPTRP